jgi:hypothetical protein
MPRISVIVCPTELPDDQVPADGTVMDESYYDLLIDAAAYGLKEGDYLKVMKPGARGLRSNGEDDILLCLVPQAIPKEFCTAMKPIIRSVAKNNVAGGKRPAAAGVEAEHRIKKDGSRSKVMGVPTLKHLEDPEDRARLAGAKEGQIGYNPESKLPSGMAPCRQTMWTKEHPEETEQLMPLVQKVSEAFRRYMPTRYDAQLGKVLQTPREFILDTPNYYSVFTTITANKSWQTAAHTDKGDLKEGFGALTVMGEFGGCYLIFPKYRVAVKYREGDILLADVHEKHGNTALLFPDGSPCTEENKPERLTCVFYYQAKMSKCVLPTAEQAGSGN